MGVLKEPADLFWPPVLERNKAHDRLSDASSWGSGWMAHTDPSGRAHALGSHEGKGWRRALAMLRASAFPHKVEVGWTRPVRVGSVSFFHSSPPRPRATMDPDRYRQVQDVFSEVRKASPQERAALLDRLCADDTELRGEVEELLGFASSGRADETSTLEVAIREGLAETAGDWIPDDEESIGPYRLRKRLGEGGFGVVYEAEQEHPIRRRVALKLIKLGMDTRRVVARFESERQALAMMDHPHVAKVLDAGASESGRPFFVMELVEGLPITEFCDRVQMSLIERLELFVRVGEAVQHAHQKGIIHRDLKPPNILVKENGEPKIIDFGIAKAIERPLTEQTLLTEEGQLVGTPEYMSPEQMSPERVDLDTRADVYALGVLLYEMLSGLLPYSSEQLRRSGLAEIQRIVCEEDAIAPSRRMEKASAELDIVADRRGTSTTQLKRRLSGDLDWIVLRALEKDRERRYATVKELTEDVRRFLRHEPVLAGPPSTVYSLAKWIRRHRIVFTAASTIAASLSIGLVVTLIALIRANDAERIARAAEGQALESSEIARQERDTATLARDEATLIMNFLQETLASADPWESGHAVSIKDALDAASVRIERAFEGRPTYKAALLTTLGSSYHALGHHDLAEQSHLESVRLSRQHLGEEHPQTLRRRVELEKDRVQNTEATGRAIEELKRILALQKNAFGETHEDVGKTLVVLGHLAFRVGDWPQCVRWFRETLDVAQRREGPEHPDTLRAMNLLATALTRWGKFDEARELLDREWELRGEGKERLDPAAIMTLRARANLAFEKQDLATAEAMYRECLAHCRREIGDSHPHTVAVIIGLANCLRLPSQIEEGIGLLREALEIYQAAIGDDHPYTLTCLNNLGRSLLSQNQVVEAEKILSRNLEASRAVYGESHPEYARALGAMGLLHFQKQTFDEAVDFHERALEIYSDTEEEQTVDYAMALQNYCAALVRGGHYERGLSSVAKLIELDKRLYGDDHPIVGDDIQWRARALWGLGRYEEAVSAAEESQSMMREGQVSWVGATNRLASYYEGRGRFEDAEEQYLMVLELASPDWARQRRDAFEGLSRMYALQGRSGELAEIRSEYGIDSDG